MKVFLVTKDTCTAAFWVHNNEKNRLELCINEVELGDDGYIRTKLSGVMFVPLTMEFAIGFDTETIVVPLGQEDIVESVEDAAGLIRKKLPKILMLFLQKFMQHVEETANKAENLKVFNANEVIEQVAREVFIG